MTALILAMLLAVTVNGGIPPKTHDASWHKVCGDPHAYFSSTLGGDGDTLCGNFGLLPATNQDDIRLYEYWQGISYHIDVQLTKVNGRSMITEIHFYFPSESLRVTLNSIKDFPNNYHQWDGSFNQTSGFNRMSLKNGLITYEFTPAVKVLVTKMGEGLCFEIVEFHRQFPRGYLGRLQSYSIQQTGPNSAIATRNNIASTAITVNKLSNPVTGTCWEIPDADSFETFFEGIPEDFDGH